MSQISLQSGPKISLALVANMFWDLFFVAISSRTVKCRGSTKSDSATGFAGLAPVSRFPGLGTDFTFSLAWHRLRVFPRLARFFVYRFLVTVLAMPPVLSMGSVSILQRTF